MSWETELALEFKSRNNPPQIGAVMGEVSSAKPFRASILNGQFLLDEENSYVCGQLLERVSRIEISGQYDLGSINITGECKLGEVVKPGDFVLVIPSGDNQTFFIIDVVKGVK